MSTTAKRKKTAEIKPTSDAEHKALVDSLRGSMAWMTLTVDEYLREKHAETDAENHT